jgi:hypothetical protein
MSNNAQFAARLWAVLREGSMGHSTRIVTCSACGRRARHEAHGLCRPCYQRGWEATRRRAARPCPHCEQVAVFNRRVCARCWYRLYRPRCADCGAARLVRGGGLCARCTARAARWRPDRQAPPPQGRCPGVPGLVCGRPVALVQAPFAAYCARCAGLRAPAPVYVLYYPDAARQEVAA